MPTKTKPKTKIASPAPSPALASPQCAANRLADDLLFGAQAIADEIGAPLRKTFHLLENGHLPADKLGATWASTRSRLRRFFDGGAS
jgi:hypothetical protein